MNNESSAVARKVATFLADKYQDLDLLKKVDLEIVRLNQSESSLSDFEESLDVGNITEIASLIVAIAALAHDFIKSRGKNDNQAKMTITKRIDIKIIGRFDNDLLNEIIDRSIEEVDVIESQKKLPDN
jgi:hypothetical protein